MLVGNTTGMGSLTQMRNIEELERERDVFADGDENEGEDVVMHSPPPPPASHHQPGSASNSPASPGSPGSSTILFSRIGSVKRWGVRRRRDRGSSSTPCKVTMIGRSGTFRFLQISFFLLTDNVCWYRLRGELLTT